MTSSGRRVGRPAAFWLTAFAFATTMVATTMPTPLYPFYEQRFGFGAFTVTVVFAAYAVGVLAALLGFGRASDVIGRRPALLAGLAVSALSSVVFVIVGGLHSGGLPMLLLGRVLSGLSAGVFTGTATAALSDFAESGRHARASLIAAVVNVGGLGLGPLVSGVLARWVGSPLRTPFVSHLCLAALAAAAIVAIPEPVTVSGPRRPRMQRLRVPAQARAAFVTAGTAGFAGFAVLGLFTAVSPAVLALLGHHDPALTGLVVFSVFAASAGAQLVSATLAARASLLIGTAALIAGMALVGGAIATSSLGLLVCGGVVSGAGQGFSFRAALAAVTAASPADERATVASSFFAVCYVGISVPVVGVGAGIKAYGLVHTGEVFAGIVAAICLAAFLSLARRAPQLGTGVR